MKSFYKLTFTQLKLFSREPVALFFTLVFPILLLFLFGFIFGNEPDSNYGGGRYGYIDAEVPGLTAIIIGTIALMSIPISTATAREQKVLRRYQATPMNPLAYLAADIAVYFLLALVGLILLVILAKLVFDLRFGGNWLAVFLGFMLSSLAFMSIGYVIASIAPTGRVAQVAGQVIFFPMIFLSGATLPLEIMPAGVQNVSRLLPLTHVVKLLQDLWFGIGWNSTAVLVLVGLMVVGLALSARTFRWE